ncbi:hypothetical protein BBK82_34045 [Lentzea guizhouensis]|uniref:Peptidase S8/S53 domain-containing protein n=1 Tax=Lentzea guizhouensis TaxID=1586287 RepID=A0A1B2HRG4_9PSEU|nr:S8 family serine peptidase [Lentzea guizhouensis]ANZ40307.1 hypothetical protein BBK82_34045 [Lentzea guizhouensis]
MKRRHSAAGIAAAVVFATAAVPVPAAIGKPAERPHSGLTTTVTLVTGDRIEVVDGQVRPVRGEGRDGIGFRTHTDVRGGLHVVPSDAEEQIAAGVLDPRLFDVSLLARWGYDDRGRDTTPLIVQGTGLNAVQTPKNGRFWSAARAAGTTKVWLDGKVTASLDRSARQIGAPQAWEQGLTGGGVTVAVLDTGIDATHPDLEGAVVEEKNFTTSPTTDDMHGHGTHVASTITGAGKYQGIAPDAKIVNAKVIGDNGEGTESGVLAGMEWAAARAKIVNMSLGDQSQSAGDDVVSVALNRISAQTGALFVVSAGNTGGLVGSPAAADAALTVGAVERSDKLAPFSSRGRKDRALKPDITAPGVDIAAAKATNGSMGTPVGEGHVAASGTSMAAPHVAGAAAIIAAQHPTWSGQDVKAALMNSARPNDVNEADEQGAGRVDVAAAVSAQVTTSVGSLSLGTALWPHDDDQPITREVSYRNTGTAPVTLDLKIDGQQQLFTVSPARITVPAGGTADATLTADTRVDVPDEVHTAALVASNGIRIPVRVDKQAEAHDVKLTFIGHDGEPVRFSPYRFTDLARPLEYSAFDPGGSDPSGTVTRRLPKGTYTFSAGPVTTTGGTTRQTVVIEPRFEVTGPAEVVVDARAGKPAGIDVERPDAADVEWSVGSASKTAWGSTNMHYVAPRNSTVLVQPSKSSSPDFEWTVQAVKARPDGNGRFLGSPYQYRVAVTERGRVPEDVRRTVLDRDLATVDTVVRARVPGAIAQLDGGAAGPTPLRLQRLYTPGVPWASSLTEFRTLGQGFERYSVQYAPQRTFQRGKAVTDHHNTAVFGPSQPKRFFGSNASRTGDELRFDVPVFTQSGGNIGIGMLGHEGRSTLSHNGSTLAESSSAGFLQADVPAAQGEFRFHVETTTPGSVSTRQVLDWTFTSGHVSGPDPQHVPLLAVRFAPKLDDDNRAVAGRALVVPVTVERNGTAGTVTDVRTPEVQVSFDEGGTWQPATPVRAGDRWLLPVVHPKGSKSVSFKAKTGDGAGSVEQTVIRAYDLR